MLKKLEENYLNKFKMQPLKISTKKKLLMFYLDFSTTIKRF
jgi:hypothetical protein